jgi:glc operon protein GlcG
MNSKFPHTLLAVALVSLAAPVTAQEMRPTITVATAKKMADACEAKSRAEGWKMIISVVDEGGNLKYFRRMDGAYLGSIQIANLKANTAAAFPLSTKQLSDIADKGVPGLIQVPGFVMIEGGVPVINGKGQQIGAIGVSGASQENDGICAQVAVDAVKNDLK